MKMDYEKISYRQVAQMPAEKLMGNYLAAEKKLTDHELEVFDIIADEIDSIELRLLQEPVKSVNEYFGGHDDMIVTDKIKEALFWFKAALGVMNALADTLNEIAGEDDDEDEEDDASSRT